MNYFLLMPIWCAIVALMAQSWMTKKKEYVLGQEECRHITFFAIIAFLPIFLLAVFGEPISDVSLYMKIFHATPSTLSAVKIGENGWLWEFFTISVKLLFGNNVTIYRVLIGLIHSIPLILIFRKYSGSFATTLFLFVASGDYVAWMMNGLRQFAAVAIIFCSIPLLLRRKYVQVSIVVLMASMIHQSAIIMFPVILIVQGKPFGKKTLLFIALCVGVVFILGQTEVFEALIKTTEYAGGYNEIKRWDDGISVLRVLVIMVPVFLAFLGRKKIIKRENNFEYICINMSIVTLGISLIAMVTSGIYVGRLMIYTQLFNYLILPTLIEDVFDKDSRPLVYVFLVVFYLIYYYFEMGSLLWI